MDSKSNVYWGICLSKFEKKLLLAPFLFSSSPEEKMVIVDTLLSHSFMNGGYIQLRKRKRLKQNMKRTFLPSKVTMKK